MKWGNRIKLLREKKGLTQDELAAKAKMTATHISHIENDYYKSLKDEYRLALASAFEMKEEEFARYIYGTSETPDLPEANRTSHPTQIPIYTDFPFHAGSPTQPIEYLHRAVSKQSPKHIEGYIVHGNCLEPKIEDGDIIIVDRQGQIDNGDIIACLMDGELHIARLRKVADELWLENNIKKYKFQECQVAAPVIEVIKRLK